MLKLKIATLYILANLGCLPVEAMKQQYALNKPAEKVKLCGNGCQRKAYGTHLTCCQACKNIQGTHTQTCSLRNTHLIFEGQPQAKGAKLDRQTDLYKIAKALQKKIYETFETAKPPYNDELHVTLVDDKSDITKKNKNFFSVQQVSIDLTDLAQWDCAANAFALTIGNFPGHHKSIHMTIAYFPDGCKDKLAQLRKLVQQVLKEFA